MKIQRNKWNVNKHRFESYEEATVIEDAQLQQLDSSHGIFIGRRVRLTTEDYAVNITMEGAEMDFLGGELEVRGFVGVTRDPDNEHLEFPTEFRKELWIVLEP